MRLDPYVSALQPYSYYRVRERSDFVTVALGRVQAAGNRLLALQIGLQQIVWLTGANRGLLSIYPSHGSEIQPLLICEDGLTQLCDQVEFAASIDSRPTPLAMSSMLVSRLALKSFGKTVGVIQLDQLNYADPLAEQKRVAVETLTHYLALLLENLELSQVAQDKQILLEMLATARQIGQHLNVNPDATQALAEFLESGRFLFDAERCFIMLANWDTETLKLLDNHKPDVISPALPEVDFEDTPVGWVARTGEPLLIPELGLNERYSQVFDTTFGSAIRQLMCVPLRVRGEVLGVIGVSNKNKGCFDELDLNLLQILAPSAAIAVENAHRFAWQQAEAQQKAELYSVASHALRSPMMNILTSVEWILETGVRNKRHQVRLEEIRSQIFNLANLAGAILDMTRIEQEDLPTQLTPMALVPVIKKALAVFERRFPTHHFELQAGHIPPVYADEAQLAIILDHLVENAVKYSPIESTVRVELDISADQVVVSVCDQGSGIRPDELGKIFNRYYRGRHQPAKGHSLGLGLYIARKLVQTQGGDIWVNSTPGRGSCFTFTLLQAKIGD